MLSGMGAGRYGRLYVLGGAAATLGILSIVQNTLLAAAILLTLWFFLFRPWTFAEGLIFGISSVFFLVQNYAVLAAGGFSFSHRDILLMPYYEPFLWGFYYLSLKRSIGEPPGAVRLEAKALFGLILTGAAFSLFGDNSTLLTSASSVSTAALFILFHTRYDFLYALSALLVGLVVELFGVSIGLWRYPEPDFLGIPYWFAPMWLSVGVLGRRFLIPLAELIVQKARNYSRQ